MFYKTGFVNATERLPDGNDLKEYSGNPNKIEGINVFATVRGSFVAGRFYRADDKLYFEYAGLTSSGFLPEQLFDQIEWLDPNTLLHVTI